MTWVDAHPASSAIANNNAIVIRLGFINGFFSLLKYAVADIMTVGVIRRLHQSGKVGGPGADFMDNFNYETRRVAR